MDFIDLKRGDGVCTLAVSEKTPDTLEVLGAIPHGIGIAPRNVPAALQLIEWLRGWIERETKRSTPPREGEILSSYTLSKRQLTAEKRRLTVAQKSGEPRNVLTACKSAFELFERCGFPDCWHRWENARGDAEAEIQRGKPW